ncbi:type II toxin-antitoxin system PemK/MazF family toxin [uncultured Ezakiella sp.]|uniref:type II toxin-antitoxin system PemK/MazF family toxin n=1 Tax=uncultured Ezakiella sp. TaxID=1637529 RepID=UPI0025D8DF77|nr:type II toxin-antitoxin system PemK/MazF family toxin [uncultured Ezakiella sp.]
MNYFWMGVYLVNFKSNEGGELNGKHYAIILSKKTSPNKTLVVIPLTSKKKGKKYRGGITIDCLKYQDNPSCEKAFAMVNKIREIDTNRILNGPIYMLDEEDVIKLKKSILNLFDLHF